MKTVLSILLMVLTGLGCARIYRPMDLASSRPQQSAEPLRVSAALQPWGDNARYEARALGANLRVLVLGLENTTEETLKILPLGLADEVSALTPAEALNAVKQQPWLYLIYPLIPGLMIPGSDTHGSFGPSDRAGFTLLAVIGLAIGIPNAVVAARSNSRLGAFLKNQAWAPGPLAPGQFRQGLIFLRNPDPYAPLALQVSYRGASGVRRVTVVCPGAKPL